MPSKRYRLKLDHPYAKAGTIVEEEVITWEFVRLETPDGYYFEVPVESRSTWLEEVKEEVTFTKEQADAIQRRLNIMVGMNAMESSQWYNETASWLIKHTSKEQ